ncbi:MAG TPA: hypothetical protein VGG01_09045 [Xanthobacteraceae bacterium]|jgi:hypothetical protein
MSCRRYALLLGALAFAAMLDCGRAQSVDCSKIENPIDKTKCEVAQRDAAAPRAKKVRAKKPVAHRAPE